MFKLVRTAVVLASIGGTGWLVLQMLGIDSLDALQQRINSMSNSGAPVAESRPHTSDVIRIATFNIQVFGQEKLRDTQSMAILAQIVARFDIVAIQEIRSQSQDVLPRLIELVNASGRHYDFAIGPRQGRTVSKEQYGYVFNADTVEIDRRTVSPVVDPHDLLHRPPLLAAFRARGAPPEEAFTFTLVNIHTDPDEAVEEVNVLDDTYYAVRFDGRGEDDILILGDFNAGPRQFAAFAAVPYLHWVIEDQPTNTRLTELYDNIVYHRQATTEFTGAAGVLNFAEEFQLTPDAALKVSDHLPVWAEFSVYEGGRAASLARQPGGGPAR